MAHKTAIVIGAGIAGCSTAYALATRGMKVTLLERHDIIASEASGNPLAMLYPRLSGDDEASEFALAGYLFSLRLFKQLNLDRDVFNACGLLQLGYNSRELARIKKVAAQHYSPSILSYVSILEASHLAGIKLLHDALYFPDGAWVNPNSLCQRLIKHENIELLTSNNPDKLLKNNDLFEVYQCDSLIKKAEFVIIANANETQLFTQSKHIVTQAVRGQVTQLSANEHSKSLQMIVCSEGYVSPSVNKQHSLGATFSKVAFESNHQDMQVNDEDHLANLTLLKTMSADLSQTNQNHIIGGRASLRCTSPDYFPIVGQLLDSEALIADPPRPSAKSESLPWIKGLYINVAHGSRGFTSAPLCAEVIASSICGTDLPIQPELFGLLNPNRFLLRELGLKRLSKLPA